MPASCPDVMRPTQAAQYLSLSPQRLARLRLEGGGPPFCKVGRSVLYVTVDLQNWLHSRARVSTSDTGPESNTTPIYERRDGNSVRRSHA